MESRMTGCAYKGKREHTTSFEIILKDIYIYSEVDSKVFGIEEMAYNLVEK